MPKSKSKKIVSNQTIDKKVKVTELGNSSYWDYRIIREGDSFSIVKVLYENLNIVEYCGITDNVTREGLSEVLGNLLFIVHAFSKSLLDVAPDGTISEITN